MLKGVFFVSAHRGPVLILALALGICAYAPGAAAASSSDPAHEAVREINALRQANGLRPLKIDSSLTRAAQKQARDIARRDRPTHAGPDGSTPLKRARRAGYHGRYIGETASAGRPSAHETVVAWAKSAAHRRILLDPRMQDLGVARVDDPDTLYGDFWIAVYGAKTR